MILRTILLSIEVIICLLLVTIILMQKSKGGGGLGTAFGGGMGESLFGSRAGNILTKATIVLAAAFMVNTLLLALVMAGAGPERALMDEEDMPPPRTHPPVTQPIEGPDNGEQTAPMDQTPDDSGARNAEPGNSFHADPFQEENR